MLQLPVSEHASILLPDLQARTELSARSASSLGDVAGDVAKEVSLDHY